MILSVVLYYNIILRVHTDNYIQYDIITGYDILLQ